MEYFHIQPSEKSISITLYENITDDYIVNHRYFLQKAEDSYCKYYRDPSEKNLLEQPISELLEKCSIRDVLPVRPQYDSFLSLLDSVDSSLWMEKYQANVFSALVTDDSLNREAFTWARSWEKKVKTENKPKNTFFDPKVVQESPKGLLLIVGPPGCGKSTLAKVISAGSNFAYYEENCGLLGSGKDIVQIMRNRLSIKTVSGKPGILIMDQIETLDKQTVSEIVSILSSKTLKRPTIAITNDLYVPSLVPLRPISHIIYCKPLNAENLYTRLKDICTTERVYIPEAYLKTLISENNNDIRSCVNSLQLLGSGRAGKQLNIRPEDMSVAGIKGVNRSVYDIWRLIFTEKNLKGVKKLVLNFGDVEIINSGIYENYLNSKFTDYTLEKSSMLLDSLVFNDIVSQRLQQSQQYELYPYQSFPSSLANKLCWSAQIDINFPVNDKKLYKSINDTQEAMKALRSHDFMHKTQAILIEDIFSYFPVIASTPDSKFIKELLGELGFDTNFQHFSPDISKIIRLPPGFSIENSTIPEKKEEVNQKRYEELAISKRRRSDTKNIIFVYHEGLTNAVKRKVKVGDLK